MENSEIILEDIDSFGSPLVNIQGVKIPVFGAIQGEKVLVAVENATGPKKKVNLTKVLSKSKDRVDPPCVYFGECTGCQWQHISYERQLKIKYEIITNAFREIEGFKESLVKPTIPSPKQFAYRNHGRFTVNQGNGSFGFINKFTHEHVEINNCMIMDGQINKTLSNLQGQIRETSQFSVRVGQRTSSRMIQPRLFDSIESVETGQQYYEETIKGQTFRIASPSFFQVNTDQAEQVVELVINALELTGQEVVIDAFAGVGTFAVMVAPYLKKVIGIEYSAKAVEDAAFNARHFPQAEFRQGKSEVILRNLASEAEEIDAVILDPPRNGCHEEALEALVDLKPKRIIYVSCDPPSLAKDISRLLAGPFQIHTVQPVDMFPQTRHVECVVTLVRSPEKMMNLSNRKELILASNSPRRHHILNSLGLSFIHYDPEVTEIALEKVNPEDLAINRAFEKASTVAKKIPKGIVIGADTVVQFGDLALEKPLSTEEAFEMLMQLRGKEHKVITAIALLDARTEEFIVDKKISRVQMRNYSEKEASDFIKSGNSLDKAGGYAVQDPIFAPADQISGCYLNVVGLPVCKLMELLVKFGVGFKTDLNPGWTGLTRCPSCSRQVNNFSLMQHKSLSGI